jgi:O-antigen biosynthesis protein
VRDARTTAHFVQFFRGPCPSLGMSIAAAAAIDRRPCTSHVSVETATPRAVLAAEELSETVREGNVVRIPLLDRLRTRGVERPDGAVVVDAPPAPQVDYAAPSASAVPPPAARPIARGKFLCLGNEKFYVRGVTYGAFTPDAQGREYHDLAIVERDFAQMAAHGINTVRIPHTTPPRALLDAAARHGLHVMVGLSAEQYIGYLIDRRGAPDIAALIRARVRSCAGHPALLCYALGNEIPAPMARWLGRTAVQRYLERLYRVVKAEDRHGLVTYVNYPTTEYLELPFLDLVCFNVYLESQERLEAYLARLHNIAGERPLLMSELGLDSLRNGERTQAQVLDWQVRTAFASGCAGAFVFSWTDEWYRHGHDVEDWAFGLTRADRSPKPALGAVRDAFAEVPFTPTLAWPRVSVVVCTHNGARTIRDCLEGVRRVAYPDYEVIVVDDGSTDASAAIAREYDCRVIQTAPQGLAAARNTGLHAATGEIVAYLDDDAYPDPHWLTHLAATFLSTTHAGVGGPNIAPPGDGAIAECVARAPGGPVHVLVSDREAEHIPGCNMAFRKASLEAIGGFDPQFRTAGDDVDVCWRLQERGWTIGFHPAAVVWHHRRNSVRAYWKQQVGYGRAEAMLERKWPEKYNGPGHVRWTGRIYGPGLTRLLGWRRPRIYHGVWGSAPFQSLYEPAPSLLATVSQMPEWHLVTATLAGMAILSVAIDALKPAVPLLIGALVPPIAQATVSAARASFPEARHRAARGARRLLTGVLHLLQPLARLRGRLEEGLTPWRRRGAPGLAPLWPTRASIWSERWEPLDERLRGFEARLRAARACVLRGEEHDTWDLEVRGGILGAARVLMGAEDHPGAKQLIRVRWWPRVPMRGPILALGFAALTAAAAHARAWPAVVVLALGGVLPILHILEQCMGAMATVGRAVERMSRPKEKRRAPEGAMPRAMKQNAPLTVLWGQLAWHPAVRAWTQVATDGAAPETIEVLRDGAKSATYRLVGAGPGGESIIARRARLARAAVERTMYQRILPHLPLTARHYYGCQQESREFVWLFFGENGRQSRADQGR